MNKTEIRVTIDSEEKKQSAIEILEKHGEPIWDNDNAMGFDITDTSLKYYSIDNDWYIGFASPFLTEITLDQLDELLTKEKQK